MDRDLDLIVASQGVEFRRLRGAADLERYDVLLRRTYEREGIFNDKFLPGPAVQRYGLFAEDAGLVAICGLKPVDQEGADQFERLIGLSPDARRRMLEVVNVVVTKDHYGTTAFAEICRGLAEAALLDGGTMLVGVTRAALLKSFVQFGLYPAVHEPLHLLGDPRVQDFVIFYDFSPPGAVDYMRRRSAQVLDQGRRMAQLRERYLGLKRPRAPDILDQALANA